MLNYVSGTFTDLYKTPLGQEIWEFLNEPENIIRMVTASDLQRPAVEPLSKLLLARFGAKIKEDRYKMMIGHMTKQIMQSLNYHLESKNIKIRFGSVFSFASRYALNQEAESK